MRKPKRPKTTAEIAADGTAKRYDRGNGDDFKPARETTLDHLNLDPELKPRERVQREASRLLAYRSNATQKKKRKIKYINEHTGNLFPPAA